jgi:hypothetical protein
VDDLELGKIDDRIAARVSAAEIMRPNLLAAQVYRKLTIGNIRVVSRLA